MLRRPKPSENDDELIKQDEELQARLMNKRKKRDIAELNVDEAKNATRPQSKFAQNLHTSKKKKEGALDNTVLDEAVLQESAKAAVLGLVVSRNVPQLLPSLSLWKANPTPGGFPKPLKLTTASLTPKNDEPNKGTNKPRSLYMQKIEKDGLLNKTSFSPSTPSTSSTELASICEADNKLADLGKFSYILDGHSGLGNPNEAANIHRDSLSKLAEISHEQRIKERNDLMSALSPEQLEFIKSHRQNRSSCVNQKNPIAMSVTCTGGGPLEMEVEDTSNEETSLPDEETMLCESAASDGNDSYSKSSGVASKKVSFKVDVDIIEEDAEETTPHFPENELPIAPSLAKQWLNMTTIEPDKLLWMTDAPPQKPLKNNEGFTARFNFEGDLLPYDADISWREGLHHHGQEPGRAGYTLDELFIFVRSQVVQQRHIGFKILANILRNAQEGMYDGCFDSSIIHLMIDAGVVILARFGLDESTPLVFQEALRTLYFLVSSEPDEHCLTLAEPFIPLGVQPGISSSTYTKEKDKEELYSEEKELKDMEILQLDIILALIRMDILIRIRYLFESVEMSPPDVIHAIGIMTRIARHSLDAAWTLLRTPRLLSITIEQFLPHNITPLLTGQSVSKMTSVYGVPLRHVLHLLKVLSARGRQLATHLVDTFDVMSRILSYVSIEPSEFEMPLQETLILSQEAYSLWSKLLAYGLTKPQESLLSFTPLLIKQIIFYKDKVDININLDENKFNYDIGAQVLDLLTKGISVSATTPLLLDRLKRNEPSSKRADGTPEVLVPPQLEYRHFEELQKFVEICFIKWLRQLTRGGTSYQGLKLVGSTCTFLSVYLTKWKDAISYDSYSSLNKIKNIYENILTPFLSSTFFLSMLERISAHSSLTSELKPSERQPKNLDSLSSVTFKGKVIPLIRPESPFPLLLPLTRLLLDLGNLNPDLPSEPIVSFLDSKCLTDYLEDVCASSGNLANQWFTRVEIANLCNLLLLADLKGCSNPNLFHRTALCIMPFIQKGDEHLIPQLVTNIICNPDFTKDILDVEIQMSTLSFAEYKPLSSPAIAQPILSSKQLRERLSTNLPFIALECKKCMLDKEQLNRSAILASLIPFLVNSLTIDIAETSLLSQYWCLSPLKHLSNLSKENLRGPQSEQSSPDLILSVTRLLQMAYLILKYRRKGILKRTPESVTGWLRNLSVVFTCSNDLFLDVQISSYLQACLLELMREKGYTLLETNFTVNKLSSYDWYKIMLEQYGSVSYGDTTFALFVVLPLQRYWPASYKLLVFGEQSDALPFFKISCEDVEQFIPLSQFIEPPEDNTDVLTAYKSAIRSKFIDETRTPFLFHLASHHLSQKDSKIN